MSDASIKTILSRLAKLSEQVAKSDKASVARDKASVARNDELSLLIREAVELLLRKAAAIDTLRAEIRAIEGRVTVLEQAKGKA